MVEVRIDLSWLIYVSTIKKKKNLEKWRTQGTQCKKKEENGKDHEENNEIKFNKVPVHKIYWNTCKNQSYVCVHAKSLQSSPTLCNPMDGSISHNVLCIAVK